MLAKLALLIALGALVWILISWLTRRGQETRAAVLEAVQATQPDGTTLAVRDEMIRTLDRRVDLGTIYAELNRLEEAGTVASRLGEATPGRYGRRPLLWWVVADHPDLKPSVPE